MLVMNRLLGLSLLLGIGGSSGLCMRVRAVPRSLCPEPREKGVCAIPDVAGPLDIREGLVRQAQKGKGVARESGTG